MHDFLEKQIIDYNVCGFIFFTNFAWNVSHFKKNFVNRTH